MSFSEPDTAHLHPTCARGACLAHSCRPCSFQICQSHKSCEIDPVKLKDGENLENNMVRGSGLLTDTPRAIPRLEDFWNMPPRRLWQGVVEHAFREHPHEPEVQMVAFPWGQVTDPVSDGPPSFFALDFFLADCIALWPLTLSSCPSLPG